MISDLAPEPNQTKWVPGYLKRNTNDASSTGWVLLDMFHTVKFLDRSDNILSEWWDHIMIEPPQNFFRVHDPTFSQTHPTAIKSVAATDQITDEKEEVSRPVKSKTKVKRTAAKEEVSRPVKSNTKVKRTATKEEVSLPVKSNTKVKCTAAKEDVSCPLKSNTKVKRTAAKEDVSRPLKSNTKVKRRKNSIPSPNKGRQLSPSTKTKIAIPMGDAKYCPRPVKGNKDPYTAHDGYPYQKTQPSKKVF